MDNRPIGVFDSGLGGLTCISYLMKELPNERIIYFGDTARTPYGSKASATIKTFSAQIADFLVQMNVKMIIIACNTVSSINMNNLVNQYPNIPIIGIIRPAAETVAKSCDTNNSIGVIGTKATIKSRAYDIFIGELNSELRIHSTACPALVSLIEEGIIENDIMDLSIKYYLDHFIAYHNIDTLVLGCTHYPLIRPNIKKLYPSLRIINPSKEIVKNVKNELINKRLLADAPEFENIFYASDLSENFVNMINRISLMSNFKVAFKDFDLDMRK